MTLRAACPPAKRPMPWTTLSMSRCASSTKLGDLLDTVVQAGANTVNSVQFDVAEQGRSTQTGACRCGEGCREHRRRNWRKRPVCPSVRSNPSASSITSHPVFDGKGGGGGAVSEAAAVPIQPGQLTFTVTVNVTYAIK